ncbi:MAG: carbon-nitrogen hydrolase family protein [Acidobacteriota bacterium]|nr:carbon-nitrogen hydrolase family protein [Acidobacteriota bacterium]MDH3785186.1 carbon-nitrogen hydrolase family protein [Acidobacteriota bacterium]
MSIPTLAAAQTLPVAGDVAANLQEHLQFVEEAARKQVTTLVFPELSLTGYEREIAENLAFTEDDARVEPLREAAARHGMTIVAGAPVRMSTGLHIACFICAPGRSIDVYTKLYVHESESPFFQPGACNPLIRRDGMNAAVAICADANNPDHVARAVELDANAYLVSAFFMPSGYPGDTQRLQSYARDHSMAVVLANFGNDTSRFESAGGSAIWDADGNRIAYHEGKGRGLISAEVQFR